MIPGSICQKPWNHGLEKSRRSALELQLFLETLVDAIKERSQSDDILKPIFEGFDWHQSMSGLQSGLNKESKDWKFRLGFHMLLAELLLDRYEQAVSVP